MPSAWEMRKGELLDELTRRNIPFSASWTVPELRSLLVENVKKDKKGQMHFTGMTLEELRTRCNDMEINYPAKASKGDLMRLLRSNANPDSDEEITFGRYKGLGVKLRELPENYMEWIKAELKANPSPHPELARVGPLATRPANPRRVFNVFGGPREERGDPSAQEPPGAQGEERSCSGGESPEDTSTPRTGKTRRSQESSESSFSMISEAAENTSDEIRALEERLALLKEIQKGEAIARRTWGQEASEAEAVLDPTRGDDQAEEGPPGGGFGGVPGEV